MNRLASLSRAGLLFALAIAVFSASLLVLWVRRAEIPVIGGRWFLSPSAAR